MNERALPDLIADQLIAEIFTGRWKAGDRLPPERQLAEQLGVDRTSLRSALRQLHRMGLVLPLQGSGNTIQDFRLTAGVELLAAAASIPELDPGSLILREAVNLWIRLMPSRMEDMATRMLPLLEEIQRTLDEQLNALEQQAPLEVLLTLEIRLQDMLATDPEYLIESLLANSTRPLRLRLMRIYFSVAGAENHIREQHGLMKSLVTGARSPADVIAGYKQHLSSIQRHLEQHFKTLPEYPQLIRPILPLG